MWKISGNQPPNVTSAATLRLPRTKHIDVIVFQCRIYEGGGVDGSPWMELTENTPFSVMSQHRLPFNIIIYYHVRQITMLLSLHSSHQRPSWLSDRHFINSYQRYGTGLQSLHKAYFLGGVILNYFKMPRLSSRPPHSLFGRLSNQ